MSGSANVIKNMWGWATAIKFGPAGIEAVARVTASNATNYAKQNYRWLPQTGHAHGNLHGGYYWESPTILKVYVAHGMSYGVYLELAMDRHYAILEEAISEYGQSFFDGIKRIMGVK